MTYQRIVNNWLQPHGSTKDDGTERSPMKSSIKGQQSKEQNAKSTGSRENQGSRMDRVGDTGRRDSTEDKGPQGRYRPSPPLVRDLGRRNNGQRGHDAATSPGLVAVSYPAQDLTTAVMTNPIEQVPSELLQVRHRRSASEGQLPMCLNCFRPHHGPYSIVVPSMSGSIQCGLATAVQQRVETPTEAANLRGGGRWMIYTMSLLTALSFCWFYWCCSRGWIR